MEFVFNFNGITIIDPTYDETGRFTVDPFDYYYKPVVLSKVEACQMLEDGYGLKAVVDFDLYLRSISRQIGILSSGTYTLSNVDVDGWPIFSDWFWIAPKPVDYRTAASTIWAEQVAYLDSKSN